MSDSMEHVVRTAGAIFHRPRCESCMYGSHFDPPQWHSWAGAEDIAHATATGQDVEAIKSQRCACACAGPERSE
jgi:hypothetical protein